MQRHCWPRTFADARAIDVPNQCDQITRWDHPPDGALVVKIKRLSAVKTANTPECRS